MSFETDNLIEKVESESSRSRFNKISNSISMLYIHGYIPRSKMVSCREKLIKEIYAETKKEKDGE